MHQNSVFTPREVTWGKFWNNVYFTSDVMAAVFVYQDKRILNILNFEF